MEHAVSLKMLKSIKARFVELNFRALLISIPPLAFAIRPFFTYDIAHKGLYSFMINNAVQILACFFIGVCFAYINLYTVKVFKNRLIIHIEEDKYNNDTWLLTTYNGRQYSLNMRDCIILKKGSIWTHFFFTRTPEFNELQPLYKYQIVFHKTGPKFILITGFFDDCDEISLRVNGYMS